MRFYRVTFRCPDLQHLGFEWYTTKREAEAALRKAVRLSNKDASEPTGAEQSCVEVVEIDPSKDGILHALRVNATHPDNG
jgi:hypothetical protein